MSAKGQIKMTTEQLKEYKYAKGIATFMHKKETPLLLQLTDGWKPAKDLMGVLTQIDDMQ